MFRTIFRTVLRAEDGMYFKEFDTYAEAYEYVEYQLGENPEFIYPSMWIDGDGRQMYIEEL
jgi:hypothetical protein